MNKELMQLVDIIRYRLEKSIKNSDERYLNFKPGNDTRTPSEILLHLVEVSSYGLSILKAPKPSHSENSNLEIINENFLALKSHLSNTKVSEDITKKLINGPLSDTLTHIGQLAFLRRLEGNPTEWENYTNANT